jgi:succinate dehydrogenase/fumarate reductase iron-sulfur protein
MKVKMNVLRSDPASGQDPQYQAFEIEAEPEETVSGALTIIYQNKDSSLAFRFICNMQKCGECAIMVNKSPCLACEKRIEPEMTIEPLPHLPIIKDLVIDRHKVISAIHSILHSSRKSSHRGRREISEDSVKLGNCLECLICVSVCEVVQKYPERFIGPLGILWLSQAMSDSPGDIEDWEEKAKDALGMCNFCGKCWKVCPDELDILSRGFSKFGTMKKRKQCRSENGRNKAAKSLRRQDENHKS